MAAVGATAALFLPAPTSAPAAFSTGIWEGSFVPANSATRELALDRVAEAHADRIRIGILWSATAGSTPPKDPTSPSDPAYVFGDIDAAVRGAAARGLEVLITSSGAPDWAEGKDRPPGSELGPGSWKPDPAAYGDFGRALAGRYSGEFPDPEGPGTLPRVRFYEAWNEPNLTYFLSPQHEGGRSIGALTYRPLLNAFAAGVKSVHRNNKVVGPGLAPFGLEGSRTRTRPLRFLRDLLCLKGRKNLNRSGARRRSAPGSTSSPTIRSR